ncbi:MAG: DinB family protein [Balneolaceae bacterium]|nr:DinB family protein [Balneolaceae bacterium]
MPTTLIKTTHRLSLSAAFIVLLVSCSFTPAIAQSSDANTNADAVVSDFLNVYNFTSDKAVQLAGAIPEDAYDWRPAEGIRSVREAVLHIASANYFFGSMIGAEVPEGINPQEMEKSGMDKQQAIEALKESVSFIQDALTTMAAEEFEVQIDFFGNKVTKRQAMFVLGDHASEHLGQLIAYARMNNVVPPWSE